MSNTTKAATFTTFELGGKPYVVCLSERGPCKIARTPDHGSISHPGELSPLIVGMNWIDNHFSGGAWAPGALAAHEIDALRHVATNAIREAPRW